ncbi:hypothetical protein SAMD00019534_045120 [Acytostelium subglobosum LB1]|uniref:hypothetical protein n=1 Tax=Acytostelium subglobosum LB1 TaxID=1410327 RepID=UPI000644A40F|nr:hypothetical protein SAMD00019534_045120 [Acytostelium subglobosum LB1]GAM21337.1 hypothetical protein SAMD00019534_045120 [Acytostelium subglobosum LB1]|eukprot:XP_012755456.1 hypothetical protein SAMD00019534_045120 [Acytostelium subglobosum LB1]
MEAGFVMIPQQQEEIGNHNNKVNCNEEQEYAIIGSLGQGTFGTVCLIEHKQTRVRYALKELKYGAYIDPKATKYITTEKEMLTKLLEGPQHPHVVGIVKVLNETKYIFEYCDQGTLKQYFAKTVNREESIVRHMFVQILAALHFLHDRTKPIIHRDIKMENILVKLIGDKIVFKLSDFGFAKSSTFLKSLQSGVGSGPYRAPEIMHGAPYNQSVDIYALGVTLLFTATGKAASLTTNVPDSHEYIEKQSISRELKDLIKSMVQISEKRVPSVVEVLKSDWVQAKQIILDVQAGQHVTNSAITLRNLIDGSYQSIISDTFKIPVERQVIYVSYYDGDTLSPFPSCVDPLRPIYTIEKIYVYNIYTFPKLQLISIDNLIKHKNMADTERVFNYRSNVHVEQQEILEKVQDIEKMLNHKTDVFSRSKAIIRTCLHLIQSIGYRLNGTLFKQAVDTCLEAIKKSHSYLPLFEKIKLLRSFDINGVESDHPLTSHLPKFLQHILSCSPIDMSVFLTSKNLTDYGNYLTLLGNRIDEINSNNTVEAIAKDVVQVKNILEALKKDSDMQVILSTTDNLKRCDIVFNKAYTWYLQLQKNMSRELENLSNYLPLLLKHMGHIDALLNRFTPMPFDQLIEDVERIPIYHQQCKLEYQSRSSFNHMLGQLQQRSALELQKVINEELTRREQFGHVVAPRNFTPVQGLPKPINHMSSFLPTHPKNANINDMLERMTLDIAKDTAHYHQNKYQEQQVVGEVPVQPPREEEVEPVSTIFQPSEQNSVICLKSDADLLKEIGEKDVVIEVLNGKVQTMTGQIQTMSSQLETLSNQLQSNATIMSQLETKLSAATTSSEQKADQVRDLMDQLDNQYEVGYKMESKQKEQESELQKLREQVDEYLERIESKDQEHEEKTNSTRNNFKRVEEALRRDHIESRSTIQALTEKLEAMEKLHNAILLEKDFKIEQLESQVNSLSMELADAKAINQVMAEGQQ